MTEPLATIEVTHPGGRRALLYRAGTTDESAIRQIFVGLEYDLKHVHRRDEIVQFLERRRAQGLRPLIVDAGANIGASAVFFALAYPTAHVVAIEPEPGNFDLLRRNVAGLDVACVHGALAARPGFVRIVDPGLGHWGYRTERIEDGACVRCATLASLYDAAAPDLFPFLVKIDIEGGEAGLFDDAASWVARTPIIVIEPHDWLLPRQGTFRSFLRCVADQDRDFVIVGENVFSIRHAL